MHIHSVLLNPNESTMLTAAARNKVHAGDHFILFLLTDLSSALLIAFTVSPVTDPSGG